MMNDDDQVTGQAMGDERRWAAMMIGDDDGRPPADGKVPPGGRYDDDAKGGDRMTMSGRWRAMTDDDHDGRLTTGRLGGTRAGAGGRGGLAATTGVVVVAGGRGLCVCGVWAAARKVSGRRPGGGWRGAEGPGVRVPPIPGARVMLMPRATPPPRRRVAAVSGPDRSRANGGEWR